MKRTDWVTACARRLHKNGGLEWRRALRLAATLAIEQENQYGSGLAWESPEDAADAELIEDEEN